MPPPVWNLRAVILFHLLSPLMFFCVVWWLVWGVNRRQIKVCFSLDVILCGWLGSKYRLSIKHFSPPVAPHLRWAQGAYKIHWGLSGGDGWDSILSNIRIYTATPNCHTCEGSVIHHWQLHCDLGIWVVGFVMSRRLLIFGLVVLCGRICPVSVDSFTHRELCRNSS